MPTRQTVENTGTGIGKVEMRNRIRGGYRDLCCAAGGVRNDGFGVIRVSFGKTCDAVGPELDRRRQGERASIRWIVP